MKQSALLSVESLTVKFGGLTALSNIHLDLHPGEVVGIIGPNGAGKTTLFNALSGIVTPTSGKLKLHNKEQRWLAPHELATNGISRTLQGVGLFGDLTVLENVMVGATVNKTTGLIAALFGRDRKAEVALRGQAEEALEQTNCTSLANRLAAALSYPDTKRVAIARALVSKPKILLLDEPAGGLGPEDIEWMKSLIRNIKVQTSVLLVEHHMDIVMSICDRIYVLNFGELIAEGTPTEVRENPDVITAYLGNTEVK